ncbi:unnamed protein product [Urochloa decumbens]|uniref:Uncharacterized protein n=1 Tax=Urochloa decumbens TaxID=240449 RepID=A0ABC9BZC8_9POAL
MAPAPAAESQRPSTRTASRSTPATARGTHAFEITGYSLHKGVGAGNFIRSAAFDLGGYSWCIRFYPDGVILEDSKEYVAVYLELLSDNVTVRVIDDLRLVNQITLTSSSISCNKVPMLFGTVDGTKKRVLGTSKFMKKNELEASDFLRDDRLVIECDVTVIKEPQLAEIIVSCEVQVPPSYLSVYFGKLLESDKGADVTFIVQEEAFPAHRIVLAARSPVFDKLLYGPVGEENRDTIKIEDMQPAVFKALLHFIYKDSLPTMEALDADDNSKIAMHLLVAADRYAVERLKLVCESILCKSLDVKNVATILSLADQLNCSKLKDVCIEYVNTSNRMDDVEASQGFVHLKRACPAVFVDMWKKAAKSRKI